MPAGLVSHPSVNTPAVTVEKLIAALAEHDLAVLARVDHASAAAKVGLQLRPTEVILFGNPKGGTPLMQAQQTIGIDLPLKALVWQDPDGKTWLAFNDPGWLAARHDVQNDKVVAAMRHILDALAAEATS